MQRAPRSVRKPTLRRLGPSSAASVVLTFAVGAVWAVGAVGCNETAVISGDATADDTSISVTATAAPTSFTVGTVDGVSIAFSWTDNATDETGYQIQLCTGATCSSYAAVAASP